MTSLAICPAVLITKIDDNTDCVCFRDTKTQKTKIK